MTPDWSLLSLPRSRVRSKKTQPCHLMTCKSICRDGSRSILRLESETRYQTTARRGSLSIWSRTAADTAGLLHSISADISFSRSLSLSLTHSPTSLLFPWDSDALGLDLGIDPRGRRRRTQSSGASEVGGGTGGI